METYQIYISVVCAFLLFILITLPSYLNYKSAKEDDKRQKKAINDIIEPAFANLFKGTKVPKLVRQFAVGDIIYAVQLKTLNEILCDPNRAKDLSIEDYLHEYVFPAKVTHVSVQNSIYMFKIENFSGDEGRIYVAKDSNEVVSSEIYYHSRFIVCSASLECLLAYIGDIVKRQMEGVDAYLNQVNNTDKNGEIIEKWVNSLK